MQNVESAGPNPDRDIGQIEDRDARCVKRILQSIAREVQFFAEKTHTANSVRTEFALARSVRDPGGYTRRRNVVKREPTPKGTRE
jgi:hypothetical protein